ncbi:MAG: hypothetical protein K9M55_11290 [Candidatus Marinimicrobia bacterium]|nr:hypothetical protein [Candidatus Neomarinimicrobiota bacterium]MCF7923275.1 hypothetical protein [Candidatus Neomarinimicrobiota bacterium]
MDKIEKFIKDELSSERAFPPLDIDSVIAGTHSSIRRRASRRKVIYSSPIAVLLVMIGLLVFPQRNENPTPPGGELFMAGWGYSWTENQDLELEAGQESNFYDQTVDYLIDDNYFSYSEDAEAILDENDLEALTGYLKEA